MGTETAWVCIAAIAIVGIVAMAFIFNKPTSEESGVQYVYDEENRLQSMVPMETFSKVKLKPIG